MPSISYHSWVFIDSSALTEKRHFFTFLRQALNVDNILTSAQTVHVMNLLSELASSRNMFPKSLMLEGITYDSNPPSPFAEGGFGAVYKGKLDGQLPICVKIAHTSSSNQPEGDRLRRVGDTFMILSIQGKDLPPLS